MPGFMVNGFGGTGVVSGAPADPAHGTVDVYYTYTWDLINVFESFSPRSGSPLLMIREASLPTFTVGKEIVHGASLEYKFAKNVSWDDIKLTWYDSINMVNILKQWRKRVWTHQTGLGGADAYKKLTTLRTWLPSGQADVEWTLINSWPSTIRYGDLTYTNSDVKIVEATITYDWAEENSRGVSFASQSLYAGGNQMGTFPLPPSGSGGAGGGFVGLP